MLTLPPLEADFPEPGWWCYFCFPGGVKAADVCRVKQMQSASFSFLDTVSLSIPGGFEIHCAVKADLELNRDSPCL